MDKKNKNFNNKGKKLNSSPLLRSRDCQDGIILNKEETEDETRKYKIDPALIKAGWDVTDSSRVLFEVDTINSDFNAQIYKSQKDTLETKKEKAYADYVLFDGNGYPIAVVEAKKTKKSVVLGREQAVEYAEDIKKQTGKQVLLSYRDLNQNFLCVECRELA